MIQSTNTPQASQSPVSVSTTLRDYILAAAAGERSALLRLFAAVFASARAAVLCLAGHYNAHPRSRTFATYARLKYCFSLIPAILYTLKNAPERFLTPGQLRALIRCQTILAHIWRQPVDFSPLWPYLSSPENCPPPPRSAATSPSPASPDVSLRTPRSALHSSEAPSSELRTSPDPRLLRSPGCALASVLLQLAAIYGIATAAVPSPRPGAPSPVPSAPSQTAEPSIAATPPPASSSPHSGLRASHGEAPLRPPP